MSDTAVPPRLLLVELNEFSPLLIEQASRELSLPNLKRLLALDHAVTTTADEIEHQGLDPWVQWVGVHTGVSSDVHGIRRLGLTAGQTERQLWQELGRRGHRWAVWGVMNGPKGQAPGCEVFMPDPWSFEERAYPEALNNLLALPRYSARNYLEIDRKAALKAAFRLVRYFLPPQRWRTALRTALGLARSIGGPGLNVHTFATLFDYVSVLIFSEFRHRRDPDFSLIFLNHIAHLQHQFWNREGPLDPNLRFGLQMANLMVGLLLDNLQPGEAVIFANGMRQRNVVGEGFYVYRQIHPQRAIERLGVTGGKVEQCMTHDAQILFDSADDAARALSILQESRLADGEPVFYVEQLSPTKLFYQLAFDHEVRPDAAIAGPRGTMPFGDLFELICARTGAHEQRGDVYYHGIEMATELANHALFNVVLGYFDDVATLPLAQAAE